MPDELTLDRLQEAVTGSAAAFRCRRRLRPAGGDGDKVFPPTFAGAKYAIESRRVSGRDEAVRCVLLDSVQSQANRMELALQESVDGGRFRIPLIEVDFSEHDPTDDVEADKEAGCLIDAVGKVTSLQVPHRLADAILRDSELGGVPFRNSETGKSLNHASPTAATSLFRTRPHGTRVRDVGFNGTEGRSGTEVRARDGIGGRRYRRRNGRSSPRDSARQPRGSRCRKGAQVCRQAMGDCGSGREGQGHRLSVGGQPLKRTVSETAGEEDRRELLRRRDHRVRRAG